MATFITGQDIGSAWLNVFGALQPTGQISNLIVNIENPLLENPGVRREIEQTLADLRAGVSRFSRLQSVDTVANTIFPASLYIPGPDGAERFFDKVLSAERVRTHSRKTRWGTYIGRLVAYPSSDGIATNQLRIMLARLSGTGRRWSDIYEMPIDVLGDDATDVGAVLHRDARMDSLREGGPCLAHISVTRIEDVVSMIAVYRRHHYVERAYGNFLGLARLQAFLAKEAGLQCGDLTVVTGHAIAEAPDRGGLFARATSAQSGAAAIEFVARPLGSPVRDLELPAPRRGIRP